MSGETTFQSFDLSLNELLISTTSSMELPDLEDLQELEIMTEEQYSLVNWFLSSAVIVIALSGVFLNFLNIKTFILMGLKDGVTIMFLTLAFSDFCFDLVTLVQSGARLCTSIEKNQDFLFDIDPFAVDVFSNSVALSINTITTMTTTFLAIARCMCVAMPLKFKNIFTRTRCFLVCLFFAISGICLYIPMFAHMGMASKFYPERNSSRLTLWLSEDRARIKDIVVSFSYLHLSIVSQFTIVLSVIIMVSKLRQSVRFRQREKGNTNEDKKDSSVKLAGKERSVVLQVVTISLICITCNLVKMIHSLLNFFDPKYGMGQPKHYFYITMGSVRVVFDVLNSSLNFFVYLVFNSRFRSLCLACKAE